MVADHSADDFAEFFAKKVAVHRWFSITEYHSLDPVPKPLVAFDPVTVEESDDSSQEGTCKALQP